MVTYKYKSNDTRTREREKGHPIASVTGLLDEHVVQREKKGEQSVSAPLSFHIPTGSIQWVSGRKGYEHKQMRLRPRTFITKPVSSTGRMHARARSHIKPQK